MTVLQEVDHVLSAAILDELETLPGVRIHGITDRSWLEERVPTVSFTWRDHHPRDIAAALGERGIYVWDGNYYALAVTTRLGLEGEGGMVCIGAVHYNTVEEACRLVNALRTIGSWESGCHRWCRRNLERHTITLYLAPERAAVLMLIVPASRIDDMGVQEDIVL
jgi:selenocysteine lyase/cysteine desulfurase